MKTLRYLLQAMFSICVISLPVSAELLVTRGIDALMHDDVREVEEVAAALPSPMRELFKLNSMVLDLSWDESRPALRREIEGTARLLQRHCDHDGPEDQSLCGQAHFALAYVQGIEGKMILSSANARKAIALLEEVIDREPARMDERLYLGLLYYYTENLPPFVRSLGRTLKLVPDTPPGAGKPMIASVAQSDSRMKGPATFVWADVLSQGDEEERILALEIFTQLVNAYPDNERFLFNQQESLLAIDEQVVASSEF